MTIPAVEPEILMDLCYKTLKQLHTVQQERIELLRRLEELNQAVPEHPGLGQMRKRLWEDARNGEEALCREEHILAELIEVAKGLLPLIPPTLNFE